MSIAKDKIAWMGEEDFDSHGVLNDFRTFPGFLEWDASEVLISSRYLALAVRALRFKGWVVVMKSALVDGAFDIEYLSTHGITKFKFNNITRPNLPKAIHARIVHTPAHLKDLPEFEIAITDNDL